MGVILLLVAQLRLEVEAGERGGQDEDARDVHAEGHAGHALAEVGALAASVRRAAVIHEGAVHTTAHDNATRHGNPAAFHADRGHLGAVLDELQGVADDAARALDRFRDDQLSQGGGSRKGIVTDDLQTLGQNDAGEHLIVSERARTDLDRARAHRVVGERVGGRGQHQVQAILSLAVQDVALSRIHRVISGYGQRRDLTVVVQGSLGEGGDARSDVERGQGRALREGLLTDRGHRIRQGHRRLRRAAERKVADRLETAELGPEVDPFFSARGLEGTAAQGDRATQVNARELVGGAEGAGADRLELLGQGNGGERGEAEGLVPNRAQAVGQGHGGDARLLECLGRDRHDAVQDRVRASRVLGGRVQDQARVVLGVQDTVNTLVVRVHRIDLDAGQRSGLGVARGHRVGGDIGPQLDRRERRVVVEDLRANRHHGARKLDGLQACVGECAVGDLG